MNILNRLAIACALFTCAIAFGTPASAAATIISQPPCTGICVTFTDSQNIPTIRHIKFNAPSAGKASVNFNGSMLCAGLNAFTVSFDSQIVAVNTDVANAGGPGGLKHTATLAAGSTVTMNLASSRFFQIASAGVQNYFFKITKGTMDPNTQCFIYNATFTVVFVP
jgi:hypothetical protein